MLRFAGQVRADRKYHRRFSSAVFYYPFNANSAVVGHFGPRLDALLPCRLATSRKPSPPSYAADDAAIIGSFDTAYVRRQVGLDPLPLLIAQPK